MHNALSLPDPTAAAVANRLEATSVDTSLARAKVLAILGSQTPWDSDTLQAIMDDVLVDVVQTADLPAPDADDDDTTEFWSAVAGVDDAGIL
jgi:hypothetical protein